MVTSGLAQDLWVSGSKLSGDVGVINNLSTPRGEFNFTSIDLSAMKRGQGLADGMLEFVPFFNDAAGAAHAILSALPTTDVLMLYALGQSVNAPAMSMAVKQVNYDWSRSQDGELLGNVLGENANGIAPEWMEMLTAGELQQTSAGSEASRDDAASSSAGAGAVLHMKDITGTSVTVVIEDSPDDSVWSTLISFTTVSDGSEPTVERLTVSGTVNRYLRITTTGTFTVGNFAVAIRRGESVDNVAYA